MSKHKYIKRGEEKNLTQHGNAISWGYILNSVSITTTLGYVGMKMKLIFEIQDSGITWR